MYLRLLQLFLFCLLTLGATRLLAQGTGPAGHGARAVALGNAAATLGNEVWAVANNAAGLGALTRPTAGAYFENRYLISSLNVAAAALALPLGLVEPAAAGQPARAEHGVVGVEAQRFGGALYSEVRVGAAYGYRLGVVNIGGRLDMLQVSFQDLGSRRVVVGSLGGQADIVPEHLTFGVYLYNLNQARLATYQDERVPTVLRAGLAYRAGKQVLLLLESEKDIEHDAGFKAGLEYLPASAVALRAGYASLTQQTTGGVGVKTSNFQFDYTAGWHSVLGLSQFLSVSWQWERKP
jgi:hypothetical protein